MIWTLTTVQQWLLFFSAILVVGCVTWRIWVAPGATRRLGRELTTIEERVAHLGRGAAVLVLVAWLLRGVVQLMAFRDPFAPLSDDISFLLFELFWGPVWMTQGAVSVLLVATFSILGRARPPESPIAPALGLGWLCAAFGTAALVVTISLSGHAMGAEVGWPVAVTVDALHVLTAGTWIGTLTVLLITTGPLGFDPGPFAAQIERFSPMALVSGCLLVAMGSTLSWMHLSAPSDLWTSTYGRWLSAKVVLASMIFLLGFVNWRRGLPEIGTTEGATAVRKRALTEVGIAVTVVVLTAVLVHAPKP